MMSERRAEDSLRYNERSDPEGNLNAWRLNYKWIMKYEEIWKRWKKKKFHLLMCYAKFSDLVIQVRFEM